MLMPRLLSRNHFSSNILANITRTFRDAPPPSSGTGKSFKVPKKLLGSSLLIGTYMGLLVLSDKEEVPRYYPEDISATLLRRLPLNATSRVLGYFAEFTVPIFLRSPFYSVYAKMAGCNLEEMAQGDLKAYTSFSDFFARKLNSDARPIDQSASLVSPCDGEVLFCGPVGQTNPILYQVKGVRYSLEEFLGPIGIRNSLGAGQQQVKSDQGRKRLYQCTIYLHPGDYHGFHHPTEWKVSFRRHFPGKLLSVRPKTASKLGGLYTLNERVVYLGEWQHGLMTLTAVGATGVGSIRVPMDPSLDTNVAKDPARSHHRRDPTIFQLPYHEAVLSNPNETHQRGEEFGQFRLGSTVVLLFEAKEDAELDWLVKPNQSIRLGQPLFGQRRSN